MQSFVTEPSFTGLSAHIKFFKFTLIANREVFPGISSFRNFQKADIGGITFDRDTSGLEEADGFYECMGKNPVISFG